MSSQLVSPNTEATILARVVQTEDETLTPETARYWLSRKLAPADEERVEELSAKARAGSLSEDKRQELDSYLHVGMLLGLMQSKARQRFGSEAGPLLAFSRELIRLVRKRAEERCEYCRMPQVLFPVPFQIDHIIAEKHGGLTEEGNLALACPHCNLYKLFHKPARGIASPCVRTRRR